jgi:hypothetical protein
MSPLAARLKICKKLARGRQEGKQNGGRYFPPETSIDFERIARHYIRKIELIITTAAGILNPIWNLLFIFWNQ